MKTYNIFQIHHTSPEKVPIHPWENTTSQRKDFILILLVRFFGKMFLINLDSFKVDWSYPNGKYKIICCNHQKDLQFMAYYSLLYGIMDLHFPVKNVITLANWTSFNNISVPSSSNGSAEWTVQNHKPSKLWKASLVKIVVKCS